MRDEARRQFQEKERLNRKGTPAELFYAGQEKRKKKMAVILTAAVIVQGIFIGCYGGYAGYHRLFVRAAREREMQNKNFITL